RVELPAGVVEQRPPGLHVGTPTQQRPPLPLGHPTPDTELDTMGKRIGQALRTYPAPPAHQPRPVLGRPPPAARARIPLATRGARPPVNCCHQKTPCPETVSLPHRPTRHTVRNRACLATDPIGSLPVARPD